VLGRLAACFCAGIAVDAKDSIVNRRRSMIALGFAPMKFHKQFGFSLVK
jgi:hypothetical protein